MTPEVAAQRIHNAVIRAKEIASKLPAANLAQHNDREANIEALELARDVLLRMPEFEKKMERLAAYENMYPDAIIEPEETNGRQH